MRSSPTRHPLLWILPLLLLGTVLGCGEATLSPPPPVEEEEGTLPVDVASIVAIVVAPEVGSLLVGETLALEVQATLDDGSELTFTSGVAWSSTAPQVAGISAQGGVTGLSSGEANIEARVGELVASARITVLAPDAVTSVEATPGRLHLVAGRPVAPELVVTATLSDGSSLDVSDQVSWASTDESRLRQFPSGELLAFAIGWSKLVGTIHGHTVEVDVHVIGTALRGIRFTEDLYRLRPVEGFEAGFRVEGDFGSGVRTDVTALCELGLDHAAVTIPVPGVLRVTSEPSAPVTELQMTASLNGFSDTAQVTVAAKRLFVADPVVTGSGISSILSFALTPDMGGNQVPLQQIAGDQTGLNHPQGVFFDPTHEELWAVDYNRQMVTTFSGAPGANGDLTPLRRFAMSRPGSAVVYDATRDILYVADRDQDSLRVYNKPRDHVAGSVTATRTLRMPYRSRLFGLALDEAGDRLFVALQGGPVRLLALERVSQPDATQREFRVSTGAVTAIALDAQRQRLYAVTQTGGVQIYNDVDTETPSAPSATLSVLGAVNLNFRGVAYDAETDALYVSGFERGVPTVFVFAKVSTFEGDAEVFPSARIDGPATLLNNPRGVAIGW